MIAPAHVMAGPVAGVLASSAGTNGARLRSGWTVHAERTPVATGLTFEILCTLVLLSVLLVLLRRPDLSLRATANS